MLKSAGEVRSLFSQCTRISQCGDFDDAIKASHYARISRNKMHGAAARATGIIAARSGTLKYRQRGCGQAYKAARK